MGVILKENNLIYTKMNHEKFLGSSQWRFDLKSYAIVKKYRDYEKQESKIKPLSFSELTSFEQSCTNEFLRVRQAQLGEILLNASLSTRKKKEVYSLNKKKVREKCSAFFGLRQSRKFLAFYSISFPLGMNDSDIMQCFNTYLTRCRKKMRLTSYLWVAERQKNGTLHFHMLTNNYMPIRVVNYFMGKTIENVLKKKHSDIKFNSKTYNGVDVKRCNNNRKALNQYLTKYISKNEIQFFRLPYHSSRDISQLFTAETFKHENSSDFSHIKNALKHINTFVVDNEYCTIEYLNQLQPNGKWFTPPDEWYWLLHLVNEQIYFNYHSAIQFDKLPLYDKYHEITTYENRKSAKILVDHVCTE